MVVITVLVLAVLGTIVITALIAPETHSPLFWRSSRGLMLTPGLPTVPDTRRLGGVLVVPIRPFGLQRGGVTGIGLSIASLLSLLAVAGLSLYMMPRRLRVMASVLADDWGQRFLAFVIGLLGYLSLGVVIIFLVISLLGTFMAGILAVLAYLGTGLGLVVVSLAMGQSLRRWARVPQPRPLLELTLGIMVLFTLSIIPYVGWIIVVLLAILGFGTVLWTKVGDSTGWTLEPYETD
jgi:hypothetical protein